MGFCKVLVLIVQVDTNIKLTLHKALIRSIWLLCLPRLQICSRQPSTEIASPAKQSSLRHWKFSRGHTNSWFAHGFQTSIHIWLYNKIMQETSISHTKSWNCKCSEHWTRQTLTQEM
jgi:hypothetical protein